MIRLTYDEYDRIEEACEELRRQNESRSIGTNRYVPLKYVWPTVSQMQQLQVEKHLDEYFYFLFFWYTQKLNDSIAADPVHYAEYKESMRYIKKIIDRNIKFIEDEDDEEDC